MTTAATYPAVATAELDPSLATLPLEIAPLVARQGRAPIYETVAAYSRRKMLPLHTPGHKGSFVPEALKKLLTPLGVACDLPSMEATDNTFHPSGCVAEAQELAAELHGAEESFFLVNGSTIGVQSMLLAAVGPGDKVLLPRQVHKSVFAALVLSGAEPVFLRARWRDATGPIPPTADEIAAALDGTPGIRAVFLTSPTYYGVGRPLGAIADVCRVRGVPLLTDEAHGAHLRFLPPGNLLPALEYGADAAVQSVHKTLGSLVGTAMLHRSRGSLLAPERLRAMFNHLQSTSPNYLLLSSLDLVRRWMWREGEVLFDGAATRALELRDRLNLIPGVRCLAPDDWDELDGCLVDPLRLTIDVSGLGVTGFDAQLHLRRHFQLEDEFCDFRNIVVVLGPADEPRAYRRLERGLAALSKQRPANGLVRSPGGLRGQGAFGDRNGLRREPLRTAPTPVTVLTPRDAAFREKRFVPLREARDRICGELITLYPPGIPLITPGERFSGEILDYCRQVQSEKANVYAEDPRLERVFVLDE